MVVRITKDKYFTNPKLTESLLEIVPIQGYVFEPCCGEGHILRVLYKRPGIKNIYGGDIDCVKSDWFPICMDSTQSHQWRALNDQHIHAHQKPIDWVVSNPPYVQPDCQDIINNSWKYASVGVAMLLRLSYLEPCLNKTGGYRGEFLKEAPLSHLIVFNPRPQFRADTKGTDSSTVAWFVWQKGWADGTQISFINNWDKHNGK